MRKKWTDKEVELLKLHYANNFTKDLVSLLNKDYKAIYQKAAAIGLKKSKKHLKLDLDKTSIALRTGGHVHRFKKGNIPFNKNKKMPIEIYEKCSKTFFKKGNKPHNYKPIGYERITKDGYLERKIAEPNKFKCVHHLIWIEAHGAIPTRHKVIFKDNNKNNITLENLECVSYAEAMRRNSIHRYPIELKSTMRILKKLNKVINNKHKEKNGEKQN
jgi:hypothetical protein